MESLEGKFLIAAPELLDPNFVRTVVLMVQHNEQGALGLVVNRPSSKTVRELWSEVGEEPCENEQPVHLGGPVAGPLMAIHGLGGLAEIDVADNIFFAARKENLDRLVLCDDVPLKLFVGHSGWGPGQLEKEMEMGGWFTAPAAPEFVFNDDPDVWSQLLRRRDSRVAAMLNIRTQPTDPSMN